MPPETVSCNFETVVFCCRFIFKLRFPPSTLACGDKIKNTIVLFTDREHGVLLIITEASASTSISYGNKLYKM